MKTATKIGKVLGLFLLTATMMYCGQEGDGTPGGTIIINSSSGEITLYAPALTKSLDFNDVTLTMSVDDDTHFSRFEIERRAGITDGNPFEFIDETSETVFEDMNLSPGSYTYRVIAVYEIDNEEHLSEPTTIDVTNVGEVISVPNDGAEVVGLGDE